MTRKRLCHLGLVLLITGPVGVISGGCGDGDDHDKMNCTAAGCLDEITIEISDAINGFSDGEYEFTVIADGLGEITMNCTLDVGVFDKGCSWAVDLDDTSLVVKTYTGWGWLKDTDTVSVQVRLDGQLLVDEDFVPNYDIYYPNGKECDESPCYSAREIISI
ncbi:MAG: hypothetical protein GY854_18925 [Deltaproteobacteria bacterium]|nr:hypothetical protein [Deltaproteobacteria bacterium]